MKKLLLLLLCVPLIGFGQSDAFFLKEWSDCINSQRCKLVGDVINDKKNGLWKVYFDDINVIAELNYSYDKLNGFVKTYDLSSLKDSWLSELFYFENDVPIWYKSYDINGNLTREETYESIDDLN